VTTHGDSPQILISGHYPLDEPYLNVVIALGCKDQGHMLRKYTVLLDPPNYTYLPAVSPASKEESHSKTNDGARNEASGTQPANAVKKKPRQTLKKKARPEKFAKNSHGQLKVMSGAGDKPAQPGLSENERLQQREKELMKELDDKTAKHLEMQAQLAKLESKLVEMQKTLEQQNKLLASMQQQAPVVAKKTALSLDKDYWLAGPFVLVAGLAYFLARRSRRRSLDDWKPAIRELNTGNSKMQSKKSL
jgi:Tfp pilus assembly protein FimV